MIKLTPSKNALIVAQQYLKHEFRKVFSDVKDQKTRRRLDRSIENFIQRENESSFWNFLAAISDDWKLKSIFYILSSTKYRWKLKEIPISKIILTGMSPTIDKYTIKKFNRNPLAFVKDWHKDKKMREDILKTGLAPYKERDPFPILVLKEDQGFRVFDGMRRTLLTLIRGKDKIKAWIGYQTNPRGKSLISNGHCYFLSNIYTRSEKKDKELEKAIVCISKEIIKNYRNGKDVLIKRIAGWSHHPEIKRIFRKMVK